MKSLLQFFPLLLIDNVQNVLRLMGVMFVAVGLTACSSTPSQEAADDPESAQAVLAKDLAIPPNLLDPAIKNKRFDDAVKAPVEKQP